MQRRRIGRTSLSIFMHFGMKELSANAKLNMYEDGGCSFRNNRKSDTIGPIEIAISEREYAIYNLFLM